MNLTNRDLIESNKKQTDINTTHGTQRSRETLPTGLSDQDSPTLQHPWWAITPAMVLAGYQFLKSNKRCYRHGPNMREN